MLKKKIWLALIVLSLVALLAACGGGDDGNNPATTVPPTDAPSTPTPTIVQTGPVKIGAIASWSGPMAITGSGLGDPVINMVEKQVKDQGGILNGRDVKVVRYDDAGSTANGAAGVKKLVYNDKVCVVVFGGVSAAEFSAVADAAEQEKVLFVSFGQVDNLANYKFTVDATVQREQYMAMAAKFVINELKPTSAAYLGADTSDSTLRTDLLENALKAASIKTVYRDRVAGDTVDYSAYLTRIKSEKPGLVFLDSGQNEFYITIARQIIEQGGWGNIKVLTTSAGEAAKKLPGADGWYEWALWIPGLDYPGTAPFVDLFKTMYKKDPTSTHVYYYNCLWTAIHAVELAGGDSDLVKIAEAARSGNLTWETPMGTAHFTTGGDSGLSTIMGQFRGGQLVPVTTN